MLRRYGTIIVLFTDMMGDDHVLWVDIPCWDPPVFWKTINKCDTVISSNCMDAPEYSILFCGQNLDDYAGKVMDYLKEGIKVIWVGKQDDEKRLSPDYDEFIKVRLLQIYRYDGDYRCIVSDGDFGDEEKTIVESISEVDDFNLEQYLIEHNRNHNIIVRASAGTGKTSVMVDRILFLLHVEKVDPASITMITFTNDATNQMMMRLQEAIISRYRLTHSVKYMEMLEAISRIQISTIDSFSHRLLGILGVSIGYSSEPSISSDAMALSDAIDHAVNDHYVHGMTVKECLGGNLHDVTKMIRDFHNKLASRGFHGDYLEGLDWGTTSNVDDTHLQRVLKETLLKVEENLANRRFRLDTVSLADQVHELVRAISVQDDGLPGLNLRYLFIDEFQDTSNDQIRLVCEICKQKGPDLFVVGDPKQSIYRFRGADDDSFDKLMYYLPENYRSDLTNVQLVRNYRTDEGLLGKMNPFFERWVWKGRLAAFDPLKACRGDIGGGLFIRNVKKDDRERVLVNDITSALHDISNKKAELGDAKVMVLVRSNDQLDQVASICEKNNVPMVARRDLPLYLSDASRDLYMLLCSYLYPADTISQFNYLTTPYCRQDIELDGSELGSYNGSSAMISDYLGDVMSTTDWPRYKEDFKMRPALSVLDDIISNTPVIENYISILKRDGVDQRIIEFKAMKYKANLDSILSILHNKFVGDGLDLPHMCGFLRLSIATNRDDVEVDIDPDRSDFAYAMTIHKAKGLEFDTVIIPYDKRVIDKAASEIVISDDGKYAGWRFHKDSGEGSVIDACNSNYNSAHIDDLDRTCSEETRLLYVAMTRAIRNLIIYTSPFVPNEVLYSWSRLLEARQ